MYLWLDKISDFLRFNWNDPELNTEQEEEPKDDYRDYDDDSYQYFKTHLQVSARERVELRKNAFQVTPDDFRMADSATDEIDNTTQAKNLFTLSSRQVLPDKLLDWYLFQGFIGYQSCAFIAQNWLIDRGCSMKGRDAVRNGFKLIFDDGNDVHPQLVERIENQNIRFKLKKAMAKADKFKNVFGISHNLFVVDSDDPDYYEKPFNPDGIRPGSYRGIVHVDPYWITPLLTSEAVEEPGSMSFYEPTYWVISGRKYHRSHFVILRGPEVSDVLKPSYLYGGLPLTQMAAERAYAAERTANEAPQLALSKRLVIRYIDDLERAIANQGKFEEGMNALVEWRDNFGVQISGTNERIEQQDTSLSDLDVTIMTQYQIVAGIFGVPSTKLMGTSPKGFQSTGEHEIKTYHEELETIQENDLTPIVDKHHICLMRSLIAPKMTGGKPLDVGIVWNPLDVESDREQAETQEIKARTYKTIQETGAVDGYDIRDAVIADENSDFTGMEPVERPEELDELPDLEYLSESGEATPSEPPSPPNTGDQVTTPIEGEEVTSAKPYPTHSPKEKTRPRAATGDEIRKQGSKWVVFSEKGERLGSYRTKRQAVERLRQIEGHKNK